MEPPSPTLVSLVLGILTVFGALAAAFLTRRGKREENKQAVVKQEFDQQNTAFEQISLLADKYKQDATDARAREAATRSEWEARWDRQMERCRRITDSAWNALSVLLRGGSLTDEQRQQAEREMNAIQQHRDNDHPA